MTEIKTTISYLGSAVSFIISAIQENPIAQWILLGLGIASGLLSIIMSLLRLFDKVKESLKDGKIDDEERKQIGEAFDDLKDKVDDFANKKE